MTTRSIPKNLRQLALPKWPQMCVWGPDVPTELAYQIIVRTDPFLTVVDGSSNQHLFLETFQRDTGFARVLAHEPKAASRKWSDWYAWLCQFRDELRVRLAHIPLRYVRMERADSSYVYGANGFVSPDGHVFYAENVGKWPTLEDLLKDWQDIASAFPELTLTATLMSEEHEEFSKADCLASFRVEQGRAFVLDTPVMPDDTWMHRFEALVGERESPNFFARQFSVDKDDEPNGDLPRHWWPVMTAHIRSVVLPLLEEMPPPTQARRPLR